MMQRMIGMVSLIVSILVLTGCGAGEPRTAENNAELTMTAPDSIENKSSKRAEGNAESESQDETDYVMLGQNNLDYKMAVLSEQPEADKVCIRVEPSVLRESLFYYYIPGEEDQEWLQKYMNSLPAEEKAYEGMLKDRKETGWRIHWQDKEFQVFEGGFLYYFYTDETMGEREYCVEAPKLCDYIQIMLQEKLSYDKFDPADIQTIVSAKLEVCGHITNGEYFSKTITDEEILGKLAEWFCNAEYIYGGAACANQEACLELLLENGEKVCLSVAADSCSNFAINGVYYDYRPEPVWDNSEFWEWFAWENIS